VRADRSAKLTDHLSVWSVIVGVNACARRRKRGPNILLGSTEPALAEDWEFRMGARLLPALGGLLSTAAVLWLAPPAKADNALGTGFFVAADGHVLTNAHVVRACKQVRIRAGARIGAARVVAQDHADDLALLKTDLKPGRVATWRSSVGEGEAVMVYGFPLGQAKLITGKVESLTGWHSNGLRVSAPAEKGNSGSAIVDGKGQVVGVVWGGSADISNASAVTSAAAASFMRAHGVSQALESRSDALSAADLLDRAKTFSVMVLCDGYSPAADDWGLCIRGSGDAELAACGRAIASQAYKGSILSEIYFHRARISFKKGDYDRAIGDCDEALKADPNYVLALDGRGNAHNARGEREKAFADYSKAIALDPKDADALAGRAIVYLAKGDPEHAIEGLDQAIRLHPNFAEAFANRGMAYYDQGQRDRAIADFDEAIRLNPKLSDAFINRGTTYFAKGEHDRAIADLDQAIRLNPGSALAFNNRGNAYEAKDDRERAIADYNQAIRLKPSFAEAFVNRGNVYGAKGERERAIADYDQAIKLNPRYAPAYNNRGRAYYGKGERERAVADYDQAIRLNPKLVEAFINRGNAYEAKGEHDRSIADYDQAIRLRPGNASVFFNRAIVYGAKGERERAIADYDHAIRLNPRFSEAYFNRGTAYRAQGERERAIADLNQAMRLNPKLVASFCPQIKRAGLPVSGCP
jgi:tetratricopeptide (TPR) repeat protein